MNRAIFEERLPEKRSSQGVWPWRLTVFSFTILTLTVAAYIGLHWGYAKYLREEIAVSDRALASLAASVPAEDQERFLAFYRQLVVLKDILDNHVAPTRALGWLERSTHEKVFFSNALIAGREAKFQLSGRADSYEVIAEQLEILSRSPEVVSYSTGELRRVDDRVIFDLIVNLKPEAFIY